MMVTLYRREPDGSTRYITITDRQQDLFGHPTLTIDSGRNEVLARQRHITYASESERQHALRDIIDRRMRRGYEVLYTWFRPGSYVDLQSRLDVGSSGA